jgi:putative molybdopterin biosynthesis protein
MDLARQRYLQNIPLEEAEKLYQERLATAGALHPGKSERIPVIQSLGRVTAGPVFAAISSPHYYASAMDGIAVPATNTFGATETKPLRLKIGTEAFVVDTGDPIPEGCNAVIMIEDLHFTDHDTVEIIASAVPWQHVRVVGEDFIETEMVLTGGQQIRPYDLGGMLTAGVNEVDVYPLPRVALLPTGTEIVSPGQALERGSIIDSNSHVLGALVSEWGGVPLVAPPTIDDYELLKKTILEYLDRSDMLAVIAGSSAGREDFTVSLVEELGEVYAHGVAIKPGKPVILGSIRGKPVIGVPGYPVSAALAFTLFGRPVVYQKGGLPVPLPERCTAYVSKKLVSPLGAEEFIRVRLGNVDGKLVVQSLARGAGAVTSLVQADAILRVPRLSEGYNAGSEVEVELLRPWQNIARTTVVVGSHDMTLDLIADLIQEKHSGCRLISSHVGSMGGLMAIARREAHMAGIHLLDPQTGIYNHSYIKKYLPGRPVVLLNLAYRTQGLIIPLGNPKQIKNLPDLAQPGRNFINRQRGSGTRLLLEYLLAKEGIEPDSISGYEREEYTHMAVAVAVASGNADAGLGIESAAQALNLDFIPVGDERYDLCIPVEFWDREEVRLVRETLADPDFKKAAGDLLGYDFRESGQVMKVPEDEFSPV